MTGRELANALECTNPRLQVCMVFKRAASFACVDVQWIYTHDILRLEQPQQTTTTTTTTTTTRLEQDGEHNVVRCF